MEDAAVWGRLATRLAVEGRSDLAEAALRDGLAAIPCHPILSYALGVLCLARGSFEEGWSLYENRRSMPLGPKPPKFSFPEWKGQQIETLLVLPEQGLGDQIMFARYIPELVARGVSATLVCPPELAELFAPLGAKIVSGSGPVQRHDAWAFIGSLPLHLQTIPTGQYLPCASGGQGVGVMLEGGVHSASRSIPLAHQESLRTLGRSLHPTDTGARTFAETAAIVEDLSLVVSVDTSVAHLSAAMGKPTWILLAHGSDWRWGRVGTRSLWYPEAELFRQSVSGEWSGVVTEVINRLAESRR